ncbi:hypothetical protein FJ977_31905 [Mesorhizobium sp. B2-1-3A]|nr:hypothetical protein FJ977_31905 [Mesorhizobium sp. B2-1-3A]
MFQGTPPPHSAGTPLIRLGANAPIHLLPQGEKESRASSQLTPAANRVKARFERDRFSMRGLLMALLAFDAPSLNANHWAGRVGASPRPSKTTAKKTTTKTV